MPRVEGKVAELLTERDLVINKGSADGVEVGMKFKVLSPKGSDIRDPDTDEVIGSVELTKVTVEVVSTQEHLSVARTYRTVETPAVPATSLYSIATMAAQFYGDPGSPASRRVETLRSDEPFAHRDLDDEESYVKRGDPVVQIIRVSKDVEY